MTIKDLAEKTGYAVGTVSRALNGHPNVSEKARKAILEAAQAWAEEHLDGDEYIRAFGEPEERTTIMMSAATKARLSDIKAKTGKSFGDIIDEAVAKY